VGGLLATVIGAGYLGGLLAGLLAGAVVLLLWPVPLPATVRLRHGSLHRCRGRADDRQDDAFALSTLASAVRPRLFPSTLRSAGKAGWLLEASFVTEGAIPFAVADPLRVIPAIEVRQRAVRLRASGPPGPERPPFTMDVSPHVDQRRCGQAGLAQFMPCSSLTGNVKVHAAPTDDKICRMPTPRPHVESVSARPQC
jgi:hypothetical protein